MGPLPVSRKLSIDIVDYPGEWLLDLPLLEKDFATFSAESLERARLPSRRRMAAPFLETLASIDPEGPADEATSQRLSATFADYLRACRQDRTAFPRFLPAGS